MNESAGVMALVIFGVNRIFERWPEKGKRVAGIVAGFDGVQKMPTKKQAGSGLPSKHRCIAIERYSMNISSYFNIWICSIFSEHILIS